MTIPLHDYQTAENDAQISTHKAGMTICPHCQKRWGGMNTCHCAGCHLFRQNVGSSIQLCADQIGVSPDDMSNQVVYALSRSVVFGPEFQVLDAVIGLVAVDVMDRLFHPKRSSDFFGHYESMDIRIALSVGPGVIASNKYPRIPVWRDDWLNLAPWELQRTMPVYARGASRAVAPAVLNIAFAVWIFAKPEGMPSRSAFTRTPTLPIAFRSVLMAAAFTRLAFSKLSGHRSHSRRFDGPESEDTFAGITAFDLHRRGGECLPLMICGLRLNDRAYECYGHPADPTKPNHWGQK